MLFRSAQRLLAEHNARNGPIDIPMPPSTTQIPEAEIVPISFAEPVSPQVVEMHQEGLREVFGKRLPGIPVLPSVNLNNNGEINALKVAVAKLPLALRNRRFGRPSFHAHSQAEALRPQTDPSAIQ